MENVLGRKQSIKNEDWLAAVSRIEELVPRVELDKLVEDTVKEIRLQAAGKKAVMPGLAGKTVWCSERYAGGQVLQSA